MMADFSAWRTSRRCGRGPQAKHVGEGQAGPEGADLEEVAAVDAVAERLALTKERKHRMGPRCEEWGWVRQGAS